MILHKVSFNNFRQFRGSQEIDFSHGDEGNVTVVFGENGRGKTSIYRGLLFCLYGEKNLSQDAQVDGRELYLVNYPEMEEKSEERNPIKSSVCLKFTHNNEVYEIERFLLGMLDNGEVIQEDNGVRLVMRGKDGNASTTRDPKEISETVNRILDRGLREYFLFDGEKIERLTRASTTQRREISAGVKQLLDIDILETAMNATHRLRRYLDSEIESRATGELARVIKQLRDNEDRSTDRLSRIKEIEGELDLANKERSNVDKELDQIKEIRELLGERANLENTKEQLESQIDSLLLEMKNWTGKTALLLVRKTADKVFRLIDRRKQKHEIPAEIRRDLIDRLISEGTCICGRCLDKGSDEYRKIILWRNRTEDIETEDSMLNLWRYLSGMRGRYEDIGVATESILQKYAVAMNDLQITRRKLDQLGRRIGSSVRSDAAKLEKHRQQIERKIASLELEQDTVKAELAVLKDEATRLNQQRSEVERQEGIRDEISKRAALAAATNDALKNIYEEFTGESRDLISSYATGYFRELLDEEGKQTLRKVVLDSDYSIQVYDRWHKPFLANISAGQRQIVSISFITALANVAAGSRVFEMPLFMDTPFGRLSREHRKNLLERVPEWCAQWILLATDTEFGRFETKILRRSGQWGRFYLLKGAGAGSTIIENLGVEEALGLLRNEAGFVES